MKPFDFQREDLDTLKKHDYIALINIQTGGGKTALSAWAAQESGANQILIVAPQNTHNNAWADTIREITGEEIQVVGNKNKAQKEALFNLELGSPGWFAVTPQLMGYVKTDISNWTPDMLICDEIHTYNKPGGKTMKRWVQLGMQSNMRLALSGTPARRDFTRMWSNMRYLWPNLYRRDQVAYDNRWGWLAARVGYEEIYTNQRNPDGTPKKAKKWLNELEPGKLLSEAPCVIQHFRRDNCCRFHPSGFLSHDAPTVIERVVELLPAQKRIIRDFENDMLAWLDDNPMVVDLTLTQKLRIRQTCLGVPTLEEYEAEDEFGEPIMKQTLTFEEDCESPVTEEILDILEHLDEGEPVVVFLEMQRFAEVLVKKLQKAGYTAAEFSGKTVKDREGYLERFGKDFQILVATTASISNGTNGIQAVCSTEIIAQGHVDDTLMEQQDARTDRMGSKAQTVRYKIVDDMGYAKGQYSDQLTKRLMINRSTRKA